MTTEVAVAPATGAPASPGRTSAEVAITRRSFAQVWKGSVVLAVVFGGTVASSALSYVTTFPDVASRQQVAASMNADTGLAILLGPIAAVDTVGGYTVYKCFGFLTTIGAIWAVLAATRLLRGEEDAGRWQLVLAGVTRPARATVATLVALGAAVVVVFAGTTLCTLLAGKNPDVGFGVRSSVLYGISIALAPAVFVAVGAFTAQLARTRRVASGIGMAVVGVAFVIRMIADAGPSTAWLRWATPFGWIELIAPFTVNDLRPLVPAAVSVLVLCLAATVLAARRDAGDGVLAARDVARPRTFGLSSPFGLALRLERPVLVAWCAGAAAAGLAFGIIAKMTTAAIPESMTDTLDRFGVQGAFVDQYFGVAFLLVAAVVAILPAGQVGAACDEETSGRLAHLLARPTRRATWLAGRLALAAGGVVVAALLASVGAWAGAVSQGVDLSFGKMVVAGINVVPFALVALGIGALVLSVAPRAAAGTVYGVVAWSLIVDLVASMVTSASWLEHVSLFHYMALAPAQDPEPTTLVAATAIAVVLCVAATLLFDRRDLRAA